MQVGQCVALLPGAEAEQPSRTPPRLLNRTGEPFNPSPRDVLELMEAATLPDGRPLFPNASFPAHLVDEVVDDDDLMFASMRPGPNLCAELDEIGPRELGADGLVEAIRAHGRVIAHHEAQMSVLIAE